MKNISEINDCYGCGVCAIACPRQIISIQLNNDGFYAPQIAENDKCIDCGICLKVCSYIKDDISPLEGYSIQTYAAWSNDSSVRYKCSSGGISFEIGKYLISKHYRACGVKYNTAKHRAEHFVADTITDFIPSIGSKYIQSFTFDGFSELNKTDKFLVTGTPCQIDSLRHYIRMKKIEDNFVLIDFFCHGVPSMLMWQKYLSEVRKKIKNITNVSWRDKTTGWHDSWSMSIDGDLIDETTEAIPLNTEIEKSCYSSRLSKGDMFYRFFLTDRCLGKACYDKCKYKMYSSAADIRIGDLWGNTYKTDEEGISGVAVFTEKGESVLKSLENVELVKEPDEIVAEGQMTKSAKRPLGYWLTKHLVKTNVSLKRIDSIIRYEYIIVNLPGLIINRLKRIMRII